MASRRPRGVRFLCRPFLAPIAERDRCVHGSAECTLHEQGALLHRGAHMKAFYILAPLLAVMSGCSYYTTPPVAATTYVQPPNTVVLGAPAATTTPSTVIVQPNR